jgi:hypothetical protein
MKKHILCILCLLLIAVTACSSQTSQLEPTGNISDIKNVTISKPEKTEIDILPTISKLPADSCTTTDEGKTCSINRDQAIKWGWGFCENDETTLRSNAPTAQVELLVNNIRIPDNLIYQRDETYNRQQNAYCHTWFVKFNEWQSGSTVRLENKTKAGSLGTQHNVFVINVK